MQASQSLPTAATARRRFGAALRGRGSPRTVGSAGRLCGAIVACLVIAAADAAVEAQTISRLPPVLEIYPEQIGEPSPRALERPVGRQESATISRPATNAAAAASLGDPPPPVAVENVVTSAYESLEGPLAPLVGAPPEDGWPIAPTAPADSPAEELPPGARAGIFQKVTCDGTWMPRFGDRGFGQSDVALSSAWGLPCPTRAMPLLLTPGFAVHYLDGPAGVNLPPRLYDSYLSVFWLCKFSPRWGFNASVSPGWYSDFEQSSSAAFRLPGYAALNWKCTPQATVILGVAYLDREDVNILPVAGLLWNPRDDLKFELLFPKPRIAWRYAGGAPRASDWLYVAAEFGGGEWAIASSSGSDVVTLRDYRLLLGIEHEVLRGLDSRLELGYVLGRQISFRSALPAYDPTDTLLVRGALAY